MTNEVDGCSSVSDGCSWVVVSGTGQLSDFATSFAAFSSAVGVGTIFTTALFGDETGVDTVLTILGGDGFGGETVVRRFIPGTPLFLLR